MTINGKQDHFQLAELIAVGEGFSLPRPEGIIREIGDAVRQWPVFAGKAGLSKERISEIAGYHRLDLSDSRRSSLF